MSNDIPSSAPSPEQDTWLESLLHNNSAESLYLEDDGFTKQLMAALPPSRNRRTYGWVIGAMGLLGILIGGIWLDGINTFFSDLSGLLQGQISPDQLAAALVPVAVFYWLVVDIAAE